MFRNGQQQKTLEEISEMSDEELKEYKARLQERMDAGDQVDLREYQRVRQQASTNARQALSLSQRVYATFKEFFGPTPQQQLGRKLRSLKATYAAFEQEIKVNRETLQEMREQRTRITERAAETEHYFRTCQEDYDRAEKKLDEIEGSLEHLVEHNGQSFSPELQEVREQYVIQTDYLRELEHETNDAMMAFVQAEDEREALVEVASDLGEAITTLHRQQSRVGIKIRKYEVQQRLHFGRDGKSAVQHYENLGIQVQETEEFIEQHGGSEKLADIDTTYEVSIGSGSKRELVEQWLRKTSR